MSGSRGAGSWPLTERTTLLGTLCRLGEQSTAEVRFDRFTESVSCRTSMAIAESMAPMLFKRVELGGVLIRDMATQAPTSFEITSARLIRPVSLRDWRQMALRTLGGPLSREENDAFIKDYCS